MPCQLYFLKAFDTTKLLEENIVVYLHDLGLGDDRFLDMAPKVQGTKEKIGKLDLIKIKNFHASKDIMRKLEREPI